MLKYRIDENTIWEDTGQLFFHTEGVNHFYAKVYNEIKKDNPFNNKFAIGEFINKDDLDFSKRKLFNIAVEAKQGLRFVEEHLKDKIIK